MPQQSPNGNHKVTLANRTVVKTEQAHIRTAAEGRRVVRVVRASGYRTGRYRGHTCAPKHSYRNRCGDRNKTLQEKIFAVDTKNLIKVDAAWARDGKWSLQGPREPWKGSTARAIKFWCSARQ